MKHIHYYIIAIVMTVVLVACGDEGNRFSSYHCNLTIDNSKHLNAVLASAMDANNAGTFCIIGFTLKGGAKHYTFKNSQGLTSTSIFNAIDDRMKMQEHIGMNGRLIVGYSNMEYPPVFYAYDGECPNCFDLNALPMRSYPLSIDSKGTATCAHCHRQYRLNQGGFVANNTGKHLTEYRADPPQPLGVLRVY